MAKLPPGITEWTAHPITGKPRWLVRWRTPQNKNRMKVFNRLVDAKAQLAAVTAARNAGTYIDPGLGRQTFVAFADEWAAAQDQWKEGTEDAWPTQRKRLVSIHDTPLASIDQLTLKRLRADLGKKYAPNTVTVTMRYASMVMRAAFVSRRIGHDPTAGLRAKKKRAGEPDSRVGPDQVPTRSEALAVISGTPRPFRAATGLGLAGLRIGEVLGLSEDRVELGSTGGEVTIDRQLQVSRGRFILTTPKSEKVRTIKVPALVAVELRRHLRDRPVFDLAVVFDPDGTELAVDLLFRGGRGAILRRDMFYESAWKPALKGAGLAEDRFVFHSLRHFCASSLLAEGAPLPAVAGHLGDTIETVSRVYAHWLRDDRDIPVEILDRVLAPEPDALPARDASADGAV